MDKFSTKASVDAMTDTGFIGHAKSHDENNAFLRELSVRLNEITNVLLGRREDNGSLGEAYPSDDSLIEMMVRNNREQDRIMNELSAAIRLLENSLN